MRCGSGWSARRGEVGFARQEAAHAADGVLDAAFLPGGVGIAEEGLDARGCAAGEWRANSVPLSKVMVWRSGCGRAPSRLHEMAAMTGAALLGGRIAEQQAGGALMHGQDGLAVVGRTA